MAVYAISIGVNQYRDTLIPSLRSCERDARDVTALLKEGFGFDAEYLEERTVDEIEDKILHIGSRIKPGDVFIFYFSGHGKAHGKDHYLLLPRARLTAFDNAQAVVSGVISCNGLMDWTSGKQWHGVARLLVIDACRDHLVAGTKSVGSLPAFDGDYLLKDLKFGAPKAHTQLVDNLTLLNSCDLGRCAVELRQRGQGIFTAAFLTSLRQAKERQGGVTINQTLVSTIAQQMDEMAEQEGLPNNVRHQPVLTGADLSLFVQGNAAPNINNAHSPLQTTLEDDETDWVIAQAKNTVEAYESYAKRKPPGKYKTQAIGRIAALATSVSIPAKTEIQSALPEATQLPAVPPEQTSASADSSNAWPFPSSEKPTSPNNSIAARISIKHILGIVVVGGILLYFGTRGKKEEFPPQVDSTPSTNILGKISANESPARLNWQKGVEFRDTLKSGGNGPHMVVIPAGSFQQGSNESDSEKNGPYVTIKAAFAVGKYEVTVEEYLRCVSATACKEPEWRKAGSQYHYQTGSNAQYKRMGAVLSTPNAPIVGVSWDDAQAYVKWLNSSVKESDLGQGRYRLLSESEWEYAARAGSTGKWSFGEDENKLQDYAWYDKNSDDKIHEVGQKKPNAFGLYDLHGNIWEWVEDRWNADYKGAPTDGSAWTSGTSGFRVLRGGSWDYSPRFLRSAFRGIIGASDVRNYDIGFRVARTAP